jgi:hypothetical protein
VSKVFIIFILQLVLLTTAFAMGEAPKNNEQAELKAKERKEEVVISHNKVTPESTGVKVQGNYDYVNGRAVIKLPEKKKGIAKLYRESTGTLMYIDVYDKEGNRINRKAYNKKGSLEWERDY